MHARRCHNQTSHSIMAAAKAAATTLEQKLKSLVDAVDADAASQVYAGAFGGLSLGESVKQGPAPPSSSLRSLAISSVAAATLIVWEPSPARRPARRLPG